ncbi:MAG: hypothetical protein IH914_09070 [candidate division Zixibacteria bacterium]|nr:hypothetical protein [candidate division Zixibacteria bacterium]
MILAFMISMQIQTLKCYSSDLEDLMITDRIFKSTAIRVYAKKRSVVGTGFFSKLQQTDSMLMFISNKHLFEKDTVLELIIPVVDSAYRIVDTFDILIPLLKKGSILYLTPSDSLDIAAILIKKNFGSKNVGSFSSLPTNFYMEFETLYTGMKVKFYGFPLDITVNRWSPLVRSGIIAGADSISRIVYLDAQAFGGSSGSPVFLDNMGSLSREFTKIHPSKYLVGIISAYKPYVKRLLNVETNKIEMVQTENSGIAIVIPASEFQSLADSLWSKHARQSMQEK